MRRLDLDTALGAPGGPKRTAALAAWLQSLYSSPDAAPILVGGGAVELYTAGAYATGDLDFVGDVPDEVAAELARTGFERKGRHWVHEEGRVYFEFPGRRLEPASEPARLRRGGSTLRIIRAEALLADRLAAWKFWRSEVDLLNALRLLRARRGRLDPREALRCVRLLDVEDAWRRLRSWDQKLGRRWPSQAEIESWLRRGS
jgi:hypothetical protein